jgi:hypothetical protein
LNTFVGGLIWLALGGIVELFGALLLLEGALWLSGRALITTYVRNWGYGHWFWYLLIGFVLIVAFTMAITHFVVDGGGTRAAGAKLIG